MKYVLLIIVLIMIVSFIVKKEKANYNDEIQRIADRLTKEIDELIAKIDEKDKDEIKKIADMHKKKLNDALEKFKHSKISKRTAFRVFSDIQSIEKEWNKEIEIADELEKCIN